MSTAFANAHRKRQVSGYEWQRRRTKVIARDGGFCRLNLQGCTRTATTADHIIGVSAGGSDEEGNLRASCAACNETRRREQARRPSRRREPERHPGLIT